MEVLEERPPVAAAFLQTEQVAVQRIGEFTAPLAGNSRRGLVKGGSMRGDEMFPRLVRPRGTGAGERQVLEVEGVEIERHLTLGRGEPRKPEARLRSRATANRSRGTRQRSACERAYR